MDSNKASSGNIFAIATMFALFFMIAFVTNFASEPRTVDLGPAPRKNLLDGAVLSGSVELPPFGVLALADPV